MSDLELIPERERHRTADLTNDSYDGLLRAALGLNERILLATWGALALRYNQTGNPVWKSGILVLTDERILLVQPRKKTITGKFKERPLIEVPLANVFGTGIHRFITDAVVIEYNASGRYEAHMLSIGEPPRGAPAPSPDAFPDSDYADIWRVTAIDAAEIRGGTQNLPPGIER